MDAGAVEPITRWLGVTITLVGAFIVSPAATVALLGRWQRRTVRGVRRVEDAVRKLVQRPRRITGQIRSVLPAMEGSASGTFKWTGTAVGATPDDSVEGRLHRLEQRATTAEARLAQVSSQADADRAAFREESAKIAEDHRAGTAEVHARLDHSEAQAVELDAAALPVVALGVFVSGLAPDAHRLPVVLWVLVLAAAVAATVRGVLSARSRRHSPSP